MKKVLLAIDGTRRSLTAAEYVSQKFGPKSTMVYAVALGEAALKETGRTGMPEGIENVLKGFCLEKKLFPSRTAGEKIVGFMYDNNIGTMVMAKPKRFGCGSDFDAAGQYAAKYSDSIVIMVP